MVELRDSRNRNVREWMRSQSLDALVLSSADNIRYVVDYRSVIISEAWDWSIAIVNPDGQAMIIVPQTNEVVCEPPPDNSYVTELYPGCGWGPMWTNPKTVSRAIATQLRGFRASRIGYDGLHPELLRSVRETVRAEYLWIGVDLLQLRSIKLEPEMAAIRASYELNAAALRTALRSAAVGVTDRELLTRALQWQYRNGADIATHSTCIVHPPLGDWFPGDRAISEGESVWMDLVCYGKEGYASDLTRTVFIGEPPQEVLNAYRVLIDAQLEGLSQVKAGCNVTVIQDSVQAYLKAHDLAPTPYGLGHGVGLRVCEWPIINSPERLDDPATLEAGQVIAIEPETTVVVRDRSFPLKVEDNILVTEHGFERLSAEWKLSDIVLQA
jgi:Xaa-Pro aminopeptidase